MYVVSRNHSSGGSSMGVGRCALAERWSRGLYPRKHHIVLLNVLFLSKLSFIGPVASNERTLLLFMLNVAQVVLAFAIFYRLTRFTYRLVTRSSKPLGCFGRSPTPKGSMASLDFKS